MLDFRADGTIAAEFDRIEERDGRQVLAETILVTMRRPTIADLEVLWQAYDEAGAEDDEAILAEAAEAAEADVEVPEKSIQETPAERRKKMFDTMRRNALWYQDAFGRLGDRSIDDLGMPVWFGNATAAANMIAHWQDVPLAPGATRLLKQLQGVQSS